MTSDSRAHAILSRQAELETERSQHEAVWEAVSEICDPDAPDIWGRQAGAASKAEPQERRGARVYANTINAAANRLAAGLESLIIPQSEKWHGLSTAAMNDEESDEERNGRKRCAILFALQYSANSNFVPGTQACLRNVVRYGPAYLYVEEGFGGTPTAMPRFPWSRAISRATAGGRSTPSTAAMSARRGRRRSSWL